MILVVIVSFIFGLLFVGSRTLFLNSFSEVERDGMARSLQRARTALEQQLEQIAITNSDYSGWDEAYDFVQSGNRDFVDVNLDDAIYEKLRLNLLVYADLAGRAVFARAYDYLNNQPLPFPASLSSHLQAGGLLLRHASAQSAVSGLLSLPEGLLLVTSRPVLTSEYKGPVQGSLVMGRFLEPAEVERIAAIAHLDLAVFPLSSLPLEMRDLLPDLAAAPERIEQAEEVVGYTILRDIYGHDAAVLRLQAKRTIYHQGRRAISYLLSLSVASGLFAAIVVVTLAAKLLFAKRRVVESERRYRSVVEQAKEGVVLLDPERFEILEANAAFAALVGCPQALLPGRDLRDFIAGEAGFAGEEIGRVLHEQRELTLKVEGGGAVCVEVNGCLIGAGDRQALCLAVHDVTERKSFEEQLVIQASQDPLTGLHNRTVFFDRLDQALAAAQRQGAVVALILIDLDRFKHINDSLGHAAGDQVLREVALRLRSRVRASDTVARFGGDEFVVLLTNTGRVEHVITVAESLQQVLAAPVLAAGGRELEVTASMGIAFYPEDGADSEVLFRKADLALYHAKGRGRNTLQFFSEQMNRTFEERLAIEAELRHALDRREFSIAIQPKVGLRQGQIVGGEVLLRWRNPVLGSVSPGKFIPIAEDLGLIFPLGEWVVRETCRQLRSWSDAGLFPFPSRLAINLSPRQFAQSSLISVVQRIVQETGIDPRRLEFEITESLMMQDVERAVEVMGSFKEMGISLSIDDFGTGHSSLSYLQRFPLDRMKVDKSFVDGIGKEERSPVVIRTIVAMAHSLGLQVVAEGVETAEQLAVLSELGCEEIQGFFFSPAVPPAEFAALLSRRFEIPSEASAFSLSGAS